MNNHALKQEEEAEEALAQARALFPEKITKDVLGTIRAPGDPVALQYLPDARELTVLPQERPDPIGDYPHSPVKGIVHRHPDRVLLKAVSACAVNCRFCFRRTMLGTPEETLKPAEMDAALSYIEENPGIREVILTGGDPLILSERRLGALLAQLESIDHISILRIHTRVPVADPSRVTADLCSMLKRRKPVYMALHVNHAQEISETVKNAIHALRTAGVILLSQSVLLKGVNDNADALESLFRALVAYGVKPYYLHHPDMVPGTSHFRVSIEEGQHLMRTLRTRGLSGLCLPSYVLDIPGGFGKIPLEESRIESVANGHILTDSSGRRHFYS